MIDVENLLRIEYHGERVLTTKQLADFYGYDVSSIRHNFNDNREHFVEGTHYFKLSGAELREFKAYVAEMSVRGGNGNSLHAPNISGVANTLYLWTKRGCIRHCKLVGTPKAWEVFNLLETTYFAVLENDLPQIQSPINDIPNDKLKLLIELLDRCNAATLERILEKLIILTR